MHRAANLNHRANHVDPRNCGGKLHARATDDPVSVVRVCGKEFLFYPPTPLLGGTTADPDGNVTIAGQALSLEATSSDTAAQTAAGW